jgi:hypothetical protein
MASSRIDSSLRPVCFGIDKNVSASVAKGVGPEKFKRYEHALYIMGQFSRLIYCDTGIMRLSIEAGLGRSSDILNSVITAYDHRYITEKRAPLSSQTGGIETTTKTFKKFMLPHESYSLGPVGSGTKYATYIASPDNVCCLVANATIGNGRLFPTYNKYSAFKESDVIVAFKGSSTLIDFKHDFMSQLSGTDLGKAMSKVGVKVAGADNIVTGSFVGPLLGAWAALIKAIEEHVYAPGTRLFITGQSLGGAYCSLFGFMLAEAIASNTGPAILRNIKSLHIVSFGSPTLMFAGARNTFNRHLDTGLVTLDRIVSQWVPMRSTAIQGALIGATAGMLPGALFGPQDGIPTIPFGFVHPGFRPLTLNMRPEAGGRPYSLDNVRKFYGVNTKSRYRDIQTWPFSNEVTVVDGVPIKSETTFDTRNHPTIKKIVEFLTRVEMPQQEMVGLPLPKEQMIVPTAPANASQEGGGWTLLNRSQKNRYSKNTQTHIPNFLSVEGNHRAHVFAHAEYLGMFYVGVFRLAGMLNPTPASSNKCAYFEMFSNGMKIQYMDMQKVGGKRHRTQKRTKSIRKTRKN